MTNEYITKQQAIDLAESLRYIAGNGITDAFIKGVEGLRGQYLGFYDPNGKCECVPINGVWYRTPKEE